MFVTSAALKGQNILPLLAREMYMVNSANGSLILALRRFVIFRAYDLSAVTWRHGWHWKALSIFLALLGGGVGIMLVSRAWLKYWHDEIYKADAFVKSLGLGNPLILYLETHEHLDVSVPHIFDPLPDNELRIDKLT